MNAKRITIFAGHYGSGKTNVALNYARALRRDRRSVAVGDLDIVNPYFRTKDSAETLAAEGIGLVVSEYANSNVDFPAMPKEIYALVADRTVHAVLDVGGDDRGALALGRFVPEIKSSADYEMLAVINASRPLTHTVADAVSILREVESACGLPFTGLVNNTNLGPETTVATVLDSLPYAAGVSSAMGLPVRFVSVDARLVDGLSGDVGDLFPLELQNLYYKL